MKWLYYLAIVLLVWIIYRYISVRLKPLPLEKVDLTRYQGLWYEIVRTPNPFETGCLTPIAEYTINRNRTLNVINRCMVNNKIFTSKGIATPEYPELIYNSNIYVGRFWVKFEGAPFAGDYNILHIDPNYQYALVGSSNRKYLWILSRKPVMNQIIIQDLLLYAKNIGYSIDDLIYNY